VPEHSSVPEEVVLRVVATVAELADTPEVRSFLLGRSREPARDSAAFGADAVVDVFRSEDPSEVDAIYRALSAHFGAHPKARELSIEDPVEPAPTPSGGAAHHVYAALWAIDDLPEL
jgi:hypothetical protein